MPPASSIAALADEENFEAFTVKLLVNFSPPRTLTPFNTFLTKPASTSSTGVITAPFSNLASKLI